MSEWAKNTIIAVAWPDHGAVNDPEYLVLNTFKVGNMGVMIGLGQGGLRCPSASSYQCKMNKNLKNNHICHLILVEFPNIFVM